MNLPDHQKTIGDAISIGVGVGSFVSWLPHIAAILTIVWTGIRIYETKTVQRLLGKDYYRQGDITPEQKKANDGDT